VEKLIKCWKSSYPDRWIFQGFFKTIRHFQVIAFIGQINVLDRGRGSL